MAELNDQSIKNLIKLSRIDCTEEEQASLLKDLRKILAYVEQLAEVNTTNVKPCYQVLEEMFNVSREDIVGDILPRASFLANAPSQVSGMIRVPPVLKHQE